MSARNFVLFVAVASVLGSTLLLVEPTLGPLGAIAAAVLALCVLGAALVALDGLISPE